MGNFLLGFAARVDGNQLRIENATAFTLLLSAATGFRGFDHFPDLTADKVAARCLGPLSRTAKAVAAFEKTGRRLGVIS